MRRCPACHWVNPDQDHYCRQCGYFLRRHRPVPLQLEPRVSVIQQVWRFVCRFPWGGFIVLTTILGVMGWVSYWGWRWTQPMLHAPPNPHFAPARPLIDVTIGPESPTPSPDPSPSLTSP